LSYSVLSQPSGKSSTSWPAIVSGSLRRSELFAVLYIVGAANGLLGRFVQSANYEGWVGAILSIDINVIVLFACFAGISAILGDDDDAEIRAADLLVAAVFLALAIVPISPISWIAVTGLSLYVLVLARGSASRQRGAVIMLALTVPMLWSRLLFQFFAKLILDIDAFFVASLLGSERTGNMVDFVDGSGRMIVLAPCSSLANMSLAFLCWISISQWAKHRWTVMDLVWSGLACASVIAVNVTRISVMGLGRSYYDAIHNEWGDFVTNTLMLAFMVTFSLLGVRREVFSRG
jgi:hypothetical protein